jgi:Ca2+-binding RTX toxin-like protein
VRNNSDEYIYGDYKYGEDALDKDLWGDDDVIIGGNGNASKTQKIHGGDGDDQIRGGSQWKESYLYGENGDDTIQVPQSIERFGSGRLQVKGGDGDDTWIVQGYGAIEDTGALSPNYNDYGFGGAGNDVIRGTHKVENESVHYGGDGHDKLYGGDATDFNLLVGNAGDDWIEGGDLAGA